MSLLIACAAFLRPAVREIKGKVHVNVVFMDFVMTGIRHRSISISNFFKFRHVIHSEP